MSTVFNLMTCWDLAHTYFNRHGEPKSLQPDGCLKYVVSKHGIRHTYLPGKSRNALKIKCVDNR